MYRFIRFVDPLFVKIPGKLTSYQERFVEEGIDFTILDRNSECTDISFSSKEGENQACEIFNTMKNRA